MWGKTGVLGDVKVVAGRHVSFTIPSLDNAKFRVPCLALKDHPLTVAATSSSTPAPAAPFLPLAQPEAVQQLPSPPPPSPTPVLPATTPTTFRAPTTLPATPPTSSGPSTSAAPLPAAPTPAQPATDRRPGPPRQQRRTPPPPLPNLPNLATNLLTPPQLQELALYGEARKAIAQRYNAFE